MFPLPRTLLARWLVLVLGAIPMGAVAQLELEGIPRSEDYILRSWVAQDGLPDVDISGIAQTPDGYLWLTGLDNLARFDGVRFTAIPASPGQSGFSAVLTGRNGTLWVVAGDGSLACLRGGRLQIEAPASPERAKSPTSLAEDADGAIWAGFRRSGEVVRWKGGEVTAFALGRKEEPIAVCSTAEGVIWFASTSHCGFFDGREFRSLPLDGAGCGYLAAARGGGVWTVAGQRLLRFRGEGKSEAVADLSWLGGTDQVTTLYEDREGNLWIGVRGVGLLRFRDGKFERVPNSFSFIGCVYEDRSGNLWVGTHGGGLDGLSRREIFVHFAPVDRSPKPVGPRDIRVGAVAVDGHGRVWMAQGQSLVRATDATNRTFELAPAWTEPADVYTLRTARSGGIWIGGGPHPHTLRLANEEHLEARLPLPATLASFLPGDEPQLIWAAVKPNPGVYESRGKDFTLIPESAGIADPVALAQDSQKRLWVGTVNGRVYFRDGARFVEAPMPDPRPGDMVTFLVPDGRDTVWIGCVDSGLYRWRAGRIDRFPPDAGLPTRGPRVLEIDPEGNFWLGTFLGLFRVPRAGLEAVLDGRESTVHPIACGPHNGMPAAAGFQYGFLPSSARTPNGHLWFGTTLGALEVVPKNIPSDTAPPAVLIEEILVRGKPLPLPHGAAPLVLPPRPGPVQIRYTLPELNSPEQVHFRYRLLGPGEHTWSPSDGQRAATFTSLPPGRYIFEVAATQSLTPFQPRPASLAFVVRAAWWETLWFRLAVALAAAIAIAACVALLVRRRMHARLRRLEQEHALERERARIARDMHDELGARITQIMLINEAARQQPRPDLDRISEAIRSVSSTLDQIVWTTNPRNDTLEGLIDYVVEFAEEYLAPTGIELLLELPADIPECAVPSDKRHEMLLVVKEALNNIVKHAHASRVRICIQLRQHELHLAIADDGTGFQPGEVARTSNGLANMRHRMNSIGGEARIESQPGAGTTVTLTAKL
jgi:signal transduction histidine kinase/ligand-binding sensor domain-containing protein